MDDDRFWNLIALIDGTGWDEAKTDLTRLRNDYLSQFMNEKTMMREEDVKEMLQRYFTEEELGEWSQTE